MFSERLKEYAEGKYRERLAVLGKNGAVIEEQMGGCTEDEQILMKFLYGTMPVRDAGEYEFSMFLGYVRHSLMVYETMEWCRGIPEDMFVNHILYCRINSENLVDCRRFFYDQLIGRIQGLSAREAVLEINYWCAENGSYEASDQRTISPVTLYRSGKGRCGEESTFAVTAFRSVGIPARQVYTPRWAHCDDNHAWVEVYVDGAWHFLGACEPEEILDKGWFSNASSRALLIHSRSFSDFTAEREEGRLGRQELLYYYNHTDTYAKTRNLQITVTGPDGKPAEGASVAVEILNGAEFFDAAVLTTDAAGKASIILGLGTVRLQAEKGDGFCERLVNVKNEEQVSLTLLPESEFPRVSGGWESFFVEAPADYPMHPGRLTREQKEKNRKRLQEAARMREERIQSYYREDAAKKYPEEEEMLRFAAGNFDEIYGFLSKDEHPDRKALLHNLEKKDYKDAAADILESHLLAARPYRAAWEEAGKLDIYEKYILNPRIFYEELTPWRKGISEFFTEEEKQSFLSDPAALWKWIEETEKYHPELDYSTIFTTPMAALKLSICNPFDKKILFVAVCRTLGIAARINPVDQEAEYDKDGVFVPAAKRKEETDFASLTLVGKPGDSWIYHQTFTIGRLENGRYVTQNYRGIQFEDGKLQLRVRPGCYRILTSNRVPAGDQLAMEYRFTVKAGEERQIVMELSEAKTEDMLVSHPLEDFDLVCQGKTVPASSVMGDGIHIAAFLSEGEEPTEHVLNEMLENQAALSAGGIGICFIFRDEKALENKTVKKVLSALPEIRVLYGDLDTIAEPLARRMYVDPDKLPLLLLLKPGLLGIYGCSGYHVGSVGLMLKLLEYDKNA